MGPTSRRSPKSAPACRWPGMSSSHPLSPETRRCLKSFRNLSGPARRDGLDALAPAHRAVRHPAHRTRPIECPQPGRTIAWNRTSQKVLTSPLARARRTSELAGFGELAVIEPDLMEWDYGEYDGLTTAKSAARIPTGRSFATAARGASRSSRSPRGPIGSSNRLRAIEGRQLLFGHGHFFRVLAARWLGLPPQDGRLFYLSTASLSILGYEHSLGRAGDPPLERRSPRSFMIDIVSITTD